MPLNRYIRIQNKLKIVCCHLCLKSTFDQAFSQLANVVLNKAKFVVVLGKAYHLVNKLLAFKVWTCDS